MRKTSSRILFSLFLACMIIGAFPSFAAAQSGSSLANLTLVGSGSYTVSFLVDGKEYHKTENLKSGDLIVFPAPPKKDGQTFDGWYTGLEGAGIKVSAGTIVGGNTTLYAFFVPEGVTPPSNVTHSAYMFGVNGKFYPNNEMTRAEAAAVFARLTDGFSESMSYVTSFSDVKSGFWYSNYIGFASSKKFVEGDGTGRFRPNDKITRGEFAVITAKFLKIAPTAFNPSSFTDTSGHFAYGYINALADEKIISGYEDKTFRPNAYISRAEAVTILNAATGRKPDSNKITASSPFSDLTSSHWAYYDILEASITHKQSEFHSNH